MSLYVKMTNLTSYEELEISEDKSRWQMTSVTGLAPGKMQTNWTKLAGHDGAILNSASLPTRNIVITLALHSDFEAARDAISLVAVPGEKVRLEIATVYPFVYTPDHKILLIDGVIDSVEYNPFSKNQETVQISVVCGCPYFTLSGQQVVTKEGNVFTNNGGLPAGYTIRNFSMPATSKATLRLQDSRGTRDMVINHAFSAGDSLTIVCDPFQDNTNVYTNGPGDEDVSILADVADDFEFFLLRAGLATTVTLLSANNTSITYTASISAYSLGV